ncbi:hypothetical protein ACJJV6_08710 [Arthrobacter nitrophenolicus]|nr:hypothetical protein [Arthrobacter nitrophenolicus]
MTFRYDLGDALAEHIDPAMNAANRLSTIVTKGTYAAGSWIATVTQHDAGFVTGTIGTAPATQAVAGIPWSLASGIDHLSALADSLQSARTIGYPLATLARGAMEAYGRAHFLVDATDTETLVKRWLATRLSDLKFASMSCEEPAEALRLEQLRDDLKSDASSLNFSAADTKLSFTALATAVHDHVYQGSDGSAEYSMLSAVAHAENSGIHRLSKLEQRDTSPGVNSARIEASDEFIGHVVSIAVTIHFKVLADCIQKFGDDVSQDHPLFASLAGVHSMLENC